MGMLGSVAGAVRRGARSAPRIGAAPRVYGGGAMEAPALGQGRLVMKIAGQLKAMHPDADNAQVLAAAQKKAAEMMGLR